MGATAYLLLVPILASPATAQQKPAQNLGASQVQVYKQVGDAALQMYIFQPADHKPADKRPAVVFFFGGGWSGGSPKQFQQQCRYLASRGMVAMAADYRVYGRQKAKVAQCLSDAKSAIRWVRGNAAKLGIDPNRIAAGGGSAGGHLAAAVGTIGAFDVVTEDKSISSRPNAMVLFNPALDLRREAFDEAFQKKRYDGFAKRWGAEPKELSPSLHIKPKAPPAILFHGTNDRSIPFAQAEAFTKKMKDAGNRCELNSFKGEGHGFFNYGRGGNKAFVATMRATDDFFKSLGYLKGEATIDEFVKKKE